MMLRAFAHYKSGHLPERGGWLEQSSCFTESMTFIAGRVADFERKSMESNRG